MLYKNHLIISYYQLQHAYAYTRVKELVPSVCLSVCLSVKNCLKITQKDNFKVNLHILAQVLLKVTEAVTFSAVYHDWGSGLQHQGLRGYKTASETVTPTNIYILCRLLWGAASKRMPVW